MASASLDPTSFGRRYLSNATCKIRPHVCSTTLSLIRLIEFAALFMTFEEIMCQTSSVGQVVPLTPAAAPIAATPRTQQGGRTRPPRCPGAVPPRRPGVAWGRGRRPLRPRPPPPPKRGPPPPRRQASRRRPPLPPRRPASRRSAAAAPRRPRSWPLPPPRRSPPRSPDAPAASPRAREWSHDF